VCGVSGQGLAEEEAELRFLFAGIDLDGNGTLDRHELGTLAERLLHRCLCPRTPLSL
jgi:hypothetical protein